MKNILLFTLLLGSLNLFSQDYKLEILWSTDKDFKTTESVIYDEKNEQIIVSCINGSPSDKDGNGYISLLDLNGKTKKLKWVEGMNAPKGMAIFENKLFVSDIDQLIEIDISNGNIVKRYPAQDAIFLNDVCVRMNGDVFVTDNRASIIYKLEKGELKKWLENEKISGPNGIYAGKNKLYTGIYGKVYSIDFSTKEITLFIDNTDYIDGLEQWSDQTFIISDFSGAIHIISPDHRKIKLSDTSADKIYAADIGFIKNKNIILVPTFYDNRVFAYKLIQPN